MEKSKQYRKTLYRKDKVEYKRQKRVDRYADNREWLLAERRLIDKTKDQSYKQTKERKAKRSIINRRYREKILLLTII